MSETTSNTLAITDQPAAAAQQYEAPEITEVGDAGTVILGGFFKGFDTMDMSYLF
jgi:hypothetical protein